MNANDMQQIKSAVDSLSRYLRQYGTAADPKVIRAQAQLIAERAIGAGGNRLSA